jgi:hypothetical protein
MKKTAMQNGSLAYPTQESISQRARELWERYGRPDGRDNEIWLEAERQLMGVDAQVEGSSDTSVSAEQFDESTSSSKPRTRIDRSSSVRKSAASPAKTTTSAKVESALKTAASDKPSLAARAKR